MRNAIKGQKGITGIGIILILAVLAGVVSIVLALFPLYNEKFQVVAAMNSIVAQPDAASMTTKEANKNFMKSMALTNISRFGDKTIKDHLRVVKSKKKGEPNMLHMQYEARNKFFGEIYFVLVFDKMIPLTGTTSE